MMSIRMVSIRDLEERSALASHALLAAVLLLAMAGCSSSSPDGEPPGPGVPGAPGEPSADASSPPAPAALADGAAEGPLVIFLGDSITAGHGLAGDQAFPALVGVEMARRGTPIRVVNAGVSGDTTSGGLGRLDWLLRQEPDVVVVELGANDGLRGLPLEVIEENLRAIVSRSVDARARVILAGMRVPPSYGPEYSEGFFGIYTEVAGEFGIDLIPFLLDGVAGIPSLNQPDGIHPTAEGHTVIADLLLPSVDEALKGR